MKTYEIRFVTHWGVQTVFVKEGQMPTPPSTIDPNTGIENFAEGNYFLQYLPEIVPATADATYVALYAGEAGKEGTRLGLAEPPFRYQMHGFRDMQAASCVYTLVLEEYLRPRADGLYRDRILSHLEALTGEGSAPQFDACCLWSYAIICAIVAMVRVTPSVWNAMSEELRLRVDTMMRAFVYLESFATADQNDYHTGPGLGGNYYKTWNPNYRLCNVCCMPFATYYFGEGDIELGAKRVNGLLHAFDESVYDEMIALFDRFGWENAKKVWTVEGVVAEDGTVGSSSKQLLCHGGQAVGKHLTTDAKVPLGTGVGVHLGGEDYLYRGIPLAKSDEILKNVVEFNYAGGPVKNGHFWDADGDGVAEQVAWILDGTDSPFYGREGMMLEFASGNRSSTAYCDHDFTIVTPLLSCADALVLYETKDGVRAPILDAEGKCVKFFDFTSDPALWEKIQVGNEDFIYKFIHGYQGYSTGSYGEARHRGYESHASRGYFAMKSLWRHSMLPRGSVAPVD